MKIGVSSYSFSRLMDSGAMTEFEVIEKAAEMGFEVIEFAGLRPPEGVPVGVYAGRVRGACAAAGLPVANYTVAADFLHGSGGDLDAEIERVRGEVRIAEALGAPGMRHDAAWGFSEAYAGPRSFAAALPRIAKGCRAVTEYAALLGIRTMVENHGYFCQDSERVERLICAVNHANFGLLMDLGNFMCVDEDPAAAAGLLAPYTFHAHAKDFHWKSGDTPDPGEGWFPTRAGNRLRGAIVGHGEVPLRRCLRLLKKDGFDGVLSLEFEGIEEPLSGIALGLENLRRAVAES
ncbi:MAG: sugar phosphate isomerase/epimerase [Candidatus Hydrogenedentes bacterium]|nr:sugar phosphate isomerase/epimerase [Candidatus Hydrogenedentota bacterium]